MTTLARAWGDLRQGVTHPQRVDLEGEVDPVAWLEEHGGGRPRVLWEGRDGVVWAGIGVAEVRRSPGARGLTTDDVPWFGGAAFDPRAPSEPGWEPFGEALAWKPAAVVCRRPQGGGTLWSLPSLHDPTGELPAVAVGESTPRARWDAMLSTAHSALRRGDLDKVVAARSWTSRRTTDSLARVRAAARGPRDTRFLLEPRAGAAFFGVTPEILFVRRGRAVQSEALAGTRRAGTAVLHSDKDRAEHRIVVEDVAEALRPLCRTLDASEVQAAVAGPLEHLLVLFAGELRADVDDAALLDALHPTSAVAGRPREAALHFLRAQEGLVRGWYAGPVWCIAPDSTQVAVAIRCVRAIGDVHTVYAGAGIVPGSDPAEEWRETADKAARWLEVAP